MKSLQAHLEAAKVYGNLSKCNRLKVGALIIKDDRIISTGYNGCVSGGSNKCEELVLDGGSSVPIRQTKKEVIHAEFNAIAFAARNGTATNGCDLVLTHSPCFDCARLIIQSGIKEVYYAEEFRDLDGVEFLKNNGVKVYEA